MHDKLKKIIFDKLYKDLSKLEIIDYNDSIWFIDRDNKYWYLEYDKVGRLYWRYDFFPNFFSLFSFEREEFEPILAEWVEEVLNCKVDRTIHLGGAHFLSVEKLLNCKINKTISLNHPDYPKVKEALNCRINTIKVGIPQKFRQVEEVLNCKVDATSGHPSRRMSWVIEVLNSNN